MTTARSIIEGAFRRLAIREAETPIDSSELKDGLEDLNDLGEEHSWFQAVSSGSSTLDIPRRVEGPLKVILAEKLRSEYPSNALTDSDIKDAWRSMWRMVNGSLDVKFPNTLPQGSGNQTSSYYTWDQTFFRETGKTNF